MKKSNKNSFFDSVRKNNANLVINTIRVLAVDMIAKANSGHPGIALGSAPCMYALFKHHMNTNPTDLDYFNRDRFILSAGHGSALLYATFLVSKFNSIKLHDVQKFRQFNSITAGHPERDLLKGVEVSTGPLGQGIAMGVGMALAETKLAEEFNQYNKLINHYTYVLAGDGCLEEGISYEAAAIAGRYRLRRLIVLYDANGIQLDGNVSDSTNINIKEMYEALGWNHILVKDGDNYRAISKAIASAKKSSRPTIIEYHSTIGYGTDLADTNKCHGSPLNEEQIKNLRKNLNYKLKPFQINPRVYQIMDEIRVRGSKNETEFNRNLDELMRKDINLYQKFISIKENKFAFDLNWFKKLPHHDVEATRVISGEVLQPILEKNNTFMCLNADLSSSTKIVFNKKPWYDVKNRSGQNINIGVREFAMAAIANGIVAHGGCKAIGSTFLSFSDYNKAAIRLAAINKINPINVFSHDSITVGEDGPTHQPVEQIAALRLIPNHYLFRPCNKEEIIAAFGFNFMKPTAPVTLITSRNTFKQIKTDVVEALKGGYLIKNVKNPKLTLVACGSEVANALSISETLNKKKIATNVVSMPCLDVFLEQKEDYQKSILGKGKVVAIEFGSPDNWYRIADEVIGLERFGKSAKVNDILNDFNLTNEAMTKQILSWIKK